MNDLNNCLCVFRVSSKPICKIYLYIFTRKEKVPLA